MEQTVAAGAAATGTDAAKFTNLVRNSGAFAPSNLSTTALPYKIISIDVGKELPEMTFRNTK